ncbi:hypothetical protein L484_022707 [Morus notabilis]|uniref:Uncharacterized protein n=1 Tax=Morus notabilis TaxID=981085 RepID=W9T0D7_9ROSA|nr:hypothetical protein L484_022707 [Morus notabilis]
MELREDILVEILRRLPTVTASSTTSLTTAASSPFSDWLGSLCSSFSDVLMQLLLSSAGFQVQDLILIIHNLGKYLSRRDGKVSISDSSCSLMLLYFLFPYITNLCIEQQRKG